MSMSDELFIFFYENILNENIFLACWTFAKTVEGKGLNTYQNLEVCYFLMEQGQIQFLCLRFKKPVHMHRQMQRGICHTVFMYSISYCTQNIVLSICNCTY